MDKIKELFSNNNSNIGFVRSIFDLSAEQKHSIAEDFAIYDENTILLGCICGTSSEEIKSGLLFCNNYIHWNSSKAEYNGNSVEKGCVNYSDFIGSEISVTKKLTSVTIEIINIEKDILISIPIKSVDSEQVDDLKHFLQSLKSIITDFGVIDYERSYDIQRVEKYVGGNNCEVIYKYRKMFERYESKGGKFRLNWSFSGFFFGPLYLLHRRAYIETIIYLLMFFLFFYVLAFFGLEHMSFLGYIFSGIVTPYFIYLKYRKSIKQVEIMAIDEHTKLKNYELRGGVNIITSTLMKILNIT